MKDTILSYVLYVILFPFMVFDYFNAKRQQGNAHWNRVIAKRNKTK